jgi:hypothetical protein
MAGLLRKFANAFVVLDEEGRAQGGPAQSSLDDMTRDTSTLIAQLETTSGVGDTAASSQSAGASPPVMSMTADDVFRTSQIPDGANAAPRLLKLIAGLTMFPREQQVTMVRAMDAADDSWSEPEVLRDAETRIGALQLHLQAIVGERDAVLGAIEGETARARDAGKAVLDEIDREIAALQARREQEAAATTAALADLERQKQDTLSRAERAREGISHVIQALTGIIAFFGGGAPKSRGPRGS